MRELRADDFSVYMGRVSWSRSFRVLRIERRMRSVPMRIATKAKSTTSAMRRFVMVGVRLVCDWESSRTTKFWKLFIISGVDVVDSILKRVW